MLKRLNDKVPDLTRPYQDYLYSYPHKTSYRKFVEPISLKELWKDEDKSQLFFYIHVPFCRSKCGYCNLFSLSGGSPALKDEYINAVERQARAVKRSLGEYKGARYALGGGTPSVFSVEQLRRVLGIFSEILEISPLKPGSVEISPSDDIYEKLVLLKNYGVKRISTGVQSFNPKELKIIKRDISEETVCRTLESVKNLGFEVKNIDLIYGIEGQTEGTLIKSLRKARLYSPEEVFLYPLYIRPLTGLDGKRTNDNAINLYKVGRDFLHENGYVQDSMRMFRKRDLIADVKDDYCCQEDGMVGLGTNARSYTKELHYATPYAVGQSRIKELVTDFCKMGEEDFMFATNGIRLSLAERKRRYLIKSILKCRGMNRKGYREYFGSEVIDDFHEVETLRELGLLEISEDLIKLNGKGIMLSDSIGPYLISDNVRERMDLSQLE